MQNKNFQCPVKGDHICIFGQIYPRFEFGLWRSAARTPFGRFSWIIHVLVARVWANRKRKSGPAVPRFPAENGNFQKSFFHFWTEKKIRRGRKIVTFFNSTKLIRLCPSLFVITPVCVSPAVFAVGENGVKFSKRLLELDIAPNRLHQLYKKKLKNLTVNSLYL